MCNDVLNNCVIIDVMNKPCHESLIRLYEAAIEAQKIDSEIPTELAKLLNVSSQTINNWAARGVSRDGSIQAESIIGCSAVWIRTGKGNKSINKNNEKNSNNDTTDSIAIRFFDTKASMGNGEEQQDYEVIAKKIYLVSSWVIGQMSGISHSDNLAILTGKGDSMFPTFKDGDLLIVDTGVRSVFIDGIYVFSANNHLYVKRIRKVKGEKLEVSSDNTNYHSNDIYSGEHELTILGRVRYIWKGDKQ